jgi:hypothetical protein
MRFCTWPAELGGPFFIASRDDFAARLQLVLFVLESGDWNSADLPARSAQATPFFAGTLAFSEKSELFPCTDANFVHNDSLTQWRDSQGGLN